MKEINRVIFTKQMKKDYTLLLPQMLPIHFEIIKEVFTNNGYKAELLTNEGPSVIQEGLKYVHNDMCYPAQLVIGQMLDAINSGKYDKHKIALIITQTGGGCRASNYIFLLRKALERANMAYVPVISLSFGLEKNPGFKLTNRIILQGFAGIVYGDLLSLLSNQTRPYEINKGETNELVQKWINILSDKFKNNKGYIGYAMKNNLIRIAKDFDNIELNDEKKIKVGIVGEIFIKFAPLGNNHLQDFLEDQGCEVMVPSLLGFFLYGMENAKYDKQYYGGFKRIMSYPIKKIGLNIVETFENMTYKNVNKVTQKFILPKGFAHMKSLCNGIIDHGVKMGEGWLLTSEMLELSELGYKNIICAQPFGCLPNHIAGKGMIRSVSERAKDTNIVPIDYDPSATSVNQENRIKLMLSIAKENMEKE
ncbi:MAG: 2-hydroxyglutaryl-CoA dehydratase [Spirochaetia bacterium]|nr:2-hydroxyglutaryl-CoA dehydratase [Spirochaetia bacterium]